MGGKDPYAAIVLGHLPEEVARVELEQLVGEWRGPTILPRRPTLLQASFEAPAPRITQTFFIVHSLSDSRRDLARWAASA